MPITKTAKRALRVADRKKAVNSAVRTRLEIAVRKAKKAKTVKAISEAFSALDTATKKAIIHKNKAARVKSQLASLAPKTKRSPTKK